MLLFLDLNCFVVSGMFTNSYIQVSCMFTIIGLIAEFTLKLKNDIRGLGLGIWSLKWKLLSNLVLSLNTISNLQQLRMFFNDFFNLVLVCKDIEPRYGRTWARSIFSTFRFWNFTLDEVALLRCKISDPTVVWKILVLSHMAFWQ